MKKGMIRLTRAALILCGCLLVSSCEPPQVYGSIGYSSYSGGGYYGGGPAYGGNVMIGGRIL